MASIKVYLHGQEIASLDLHPGQEYFAGRGSQCQISLSNERGISRQHLRFWQPMPDVWNVELLSKTGSLVLDGEDVVGFDLTQDTRFSVPPYEFEFTMASHNEDQPDAHAGMQEAGEVETPAFEENVLSVDDGQQAGEPDDRTPAPHEAMADGAEANFDATQVGRVSLIPFLKVRNTKTGFEEVLKLEGNLWVAGRHPDSEILIEDSAISRKHFEISRGPGGYEITDLGSSNGTQVNDVMLPPQEAQSLQSGDTITIRHLEIHFEIHDGAYHEKLADVQHMVPVHTGTGYRSDLQLDIAPPPTADNVPALVPIVGGAQSGPGVVRVNPPKKNFFAAASPRKKILIVGAPLLLIFALVFGGENKSSITGDGSADFQSEGAAPPSEEQLAEARDLLKLGKGHYHAGKYEFCLAQIERLHTIVPSFEDSREIENLCRQGLELERINADRERKERERIQVENKIRAIIANCKAKMTQNQNMTSAELSLCLQPATELSPEQPEITSLISSLQQKEESARIQQEQAEDAARRRARGKAIYNDAVDLEKRRKYQPAIAKYRQFLNGNYGPNSQEAQARRAIDGIQSRLSELSNQELAKCKQMIGSEKFRDAIAACDEALDISPSNSDAKASREIASTKLRRNMKVLYQDSILEESLGNLEAAKEKWNRIVNESVPEDDYYKKAKTKLRKYGL